MKKEERKGFIAQTLERLDRFGYPITFTYKNETTFRTSFGGIMTILSVMSIMIYMGIMLSTAIK